jgi:cytochrome c553
MSGKRSDALRNPWVTVSVGLTAAIALVAYIVGFAWLPLAAPAGRLHGIWATICGAAGLVQAAPDGAATIVQADYPTTQVELTPQILHVNAESVGSGATLALRCAMCHDVQGPSQAETPHLAGQYPAAIYKQLEDFKSGARVSAVMGPLVAGLSDTDMRDLAAYYGYLPAVSEPDPRGRQAPAIVAGAPMRGIAPCGACHGTISHTAGAPWLGGQPAVYLHQQLTAFNSGARRNDIDAQMRNVARVMTAAEIDAASQFYAGHP